MALQLQQLSNDFSTAAQITAEEVVEIANLGFKTIINHRPDAEGGDAQPTSAQIKASAEALGLAYYYLPIVPSNIQPTDVEAFKQCYAASAKPILGFCRTGNRVARIFELAQVR